MDAEACSWLCCESKVELLLLPSSLWAIPALVWALPRVSLALLAANPRLEGFKDASVQAARPFSDSDEYSYRLQYSNCCARDNHRLSEELSPVRREARAPFSTGFWGEPSSNLGSICCRTPSSLARSSTPSCVVLGLCFGRRKKAGTPVS